MQAAERTEYMPVSDYLAAEEASEVRHEYLGGMIYAMAGETRAHNTICLNLAAAIRDRLKNPCKLYMSGVRVNLQIRGDEYFYYPDIVVTCDPRDTHPRIVQFPKLIIEVLSESTERIDRREKFLAYTTLDSLDEYVLTAQDTPEAIIFRRVSNWAQEKTIGGTGRLGLKSLGLELSVGELYEGV
ncbi:MAG: hypothetical protein C5B50_03190 [Verrucomicrobia bacterium]|nr:MAG: hypothetical protein C5B50_03190 [Verrucomicrobiota bacterium]